MINQVAHIRSPLFSGPSKDTLLPDSSDKYAHSVTTWNWLTLETGLDALFSEFTFFFLCRLCFTTLVLFECPAGSTDSPHVAVGQKDVPKWHPVTLPLKNFEPRPCDSIPERSPCLRPGLRGAWLRRLDMEKAKPQVSGKAWGRGWISCLAGGGWVEWVDGVDG